jgi:hypothetical protein
MIFMALYWVLLINFEYIFLYIIMNTYAAIKTPEGVVVVWVQPMSGFEGDRVLEIIDWSPDITWIYGGCKRPSAIMPISIVGRTTMRGIVDADKETVVAVNVFRFLIATKLEGIRMSDTVRYVMDKWHSTWAYGHDKFGCSIRKAKLPSSTFSPTPWREATNYTGSGFNGFINAVAGRTGQPDEYDLTTPSMEYYKNRLDQTLKTLIVGGEVVDAARHIIGLGDKVNRPLSNFCHWIVDNKDTAEHNKSLTSILLLRGASGIRGNEISRPLRPPRNKDIVPREDIGDYLVILEYLKGTDMWIEFICRMLLMPQFTEIGKHPEVMVELRRVYETDVNYMSLIKYAMSYFMIYISRSEAATNRWNAKTTDSFVFTANMVAAWPIFDAMPDSSPDCPISIKSSLLLPYYIKGEMGERRTCTEEEIVKRVQGSLVRKKSNLDIIKMIRDIGWISLTGSRLANAGAVSPIEMGRYGGDFERFVVEFIGNTAELVDKLLDANEERKTDQLIFDIDEKDAEHLVDAFDKFRSPYEERKPGIHNQSDIDIAVSGANETEYMEKCEEILDYLLRFGRAVMVKWTKPSGKTTCVIFSSALNFSIDAFHNTTTDIGLISSYMTGYPRIYNNGYRTYMTSMYAIAHRCGINITQSRTMARVDPVWIMWKSLRYFQITTITNFGNMATINKYMELINHDPLVMSHVSQHHSIFNAKIPDEDRKVDDGKKHWVSHVIAMPSGGRRQTMDIWDTNTGDLIAARPELVSQYIRAINQLTVSRPSA